MADFRMPTGLLDFVRFSALLEVEQARRCNVCGLTKQKSIFYEIHDIVILNIFNLQIFKNIFFSFHFF